MTASHRVRLFIDPDDAIYTKLLVWINARHAPLDPASICFARFPFGALDVRGVACAEARRNLTRSLQPVNGLIPGRFLESEGPVSRAVLPRCSDAEQGTLLRGAAA
jgi:hypothetical protein